MMIIETSLVVQWLRFHAADAGDMGSNPGQTTKITTCCLTCPPSPQKRMMMIVKEKNSLGYDFNSEGWMLMLQTLEKITNVLSKSENGC